MDTARQSREEFGARVRKYRDALGWDMEELARRLGKSVSTISRIETGQSEVGIEGLKLLARVLGVLPSALIDDEHMLPKTGGFTIKKNLVKGYVEKLKEIEEGLSAMAEV